jgi:hypothetical protein
LNFTSGVTSGIQTQLNSKAPINNATFTGTTAIPSATITGGTINNTVIGGSTAAAGSFTTLTASSTATLNTLSSSGATITGGTINGTTIGGSTPAAISGTTGTFSGNLTVDTNTLFVDAASNRVGIGLTNPQTYLHLSDAGDTAIQITKEGSVASRIKTVSGALAIGVDGSNGNTERMRITSAGNVGIGTTSPGSKLSVQGDGTTLRLDGADNTARGILLRSTGTAEGYIITDGNMHFIQQDAGRVMKFSTANTERMRIDSSGRVLVGKATAGDYVTGVEFQPSGAVLSYRSGGVAGIFGRTNDGEVIRITRDSSVIGNIGVASSSLTFTVNSSERLRIDSSGRVGIGTSSPVGRLSVVGADNSTQAVFGGSTGTTGRGLRIATGVTGFQTNDIAILDAQNPTSGTLVFQTQSIERLRITSAGNVGIGLTPSAGSGILQISGGLRIAGAGSASDTTSPYIFRTSGADNMVFATAGSERARIDSSGSFLVGTTDTFPVDDTSGNGVVLRGSTGDILAQASSRAVIDLNRTTSEGIIANFRKDGTAVGSIGTSGGDIFIGKTTTGLRFRGGNFDIIPFDPDDLEGRDNQLDLGDTAFRWDDIYATNGTIQTSDRNEKQDIAELDEAERRVAVAAKGLLRKFRWKSAVEEKGDDARIHFGIIAQDLQAAFEAEGLDAGRYAMFIHSTWTDEETGEEKSRMGVRYPQLLAFIIAAI